MTIAAGTRLGTYEVVALIGAGGMGEVYQAHDTKLGRDVAIKVLPEQFATDPERLARFQREAKLLAALNHPNIAAIYGLEQSAETHYLVMELVPGETLRERVAGERPVPVEEALAIARQIVDALDAAHGSEKGIIHRDLKPANVKITPEGRVKVLDFGLAKAFAAEAPAENTLNSPTLSALPTMQGVIMGTAAYMSPEQARGKHVDKRTDIWAFGCVLYELLTAKAAFRGEDVTEIIAAVVKSEPDWQALPAETPANVRFVLRRCLEKNRSRRFRDAADVQIQIEETLAAPAAAPRTEATVVPAASWKRLLPWAAAVVLSVVTGLTVWSLRPVPTPLPVSRLVVPLPPNEQLTGVNARFLALSQDGAQLAYIASAATQAPRIYLRALDTLETRPLAGTEGAVGPFFSPDGQWIGFFAGGKLKKASVSGGAVLTLCDAPNSRGATWGANDTIVFAPTTAAGLSQVSAAGGAPQVLTKLKEGELSHRWPQFLPDGKSIVYTIGIGGSYDDAHIAAFHLDTGEQQVLIRGGTNPQYVPTGHLVYYRAGTIMAVPFDASRLEVRGTPAPAVEGVMSSTGNNGVAQFSFSSLGSLAYVPGGPQSLERTLVWVDRIGGEKPLPASPRAYDDPRLSPDGQQVAVQIADAPPRGSVWVYDIPRGTLARLTFDGSADIPIWTPDGKRIVFTVAKPGANGNGLSWKPADGSGAEERLTTNEFAPQGSSVSPDGQTLAFFGPAGNGDIWIVPLQGERKPRLFLQTPFSEVAPMFSPDGRWLAYSSNESGPYEIYVQPYPGPGGKWLISTGGGREPVWSRDGRELFYRIGDRMMAVDIQTQPAFKAGTPRMLFERPGWPAGTARADYDVAPDGQRFLLWKASEQQEAALAQINVVLNWFEELKRRVPTAAR